MLQKHNSKHHSKIGYNLYSKQTGRVEEPSLRESMSAVSHWPHDLHLHISTDQIFVLNGFEW